MSEDFDKFAARLVERFPNGVETAAVPMVMRLMAEALQPGIASLRSRAELAEAEVARLRGLCPHAQDGACLDWQKRAELAQARYEQEKILHDQAQAEANERHAAARIWYGPNGPKVLESPAEVVRRRKAAAEEITALRAELLSAREALRLVAEGEHGESCRARNETLFMGNVRGACEDDCPKSIARAALSPSPKGTPNGEGR